MCMQNHVQIFFCAGQIIELLFEAHDQEVKTGDKWRFDE